MVASSNESLRRVEVFIAQLAAFKAEAKRRHTQNASPSPAAVAIVECNLGVGEVGEQDFSLEGPSDEANVQDSARRVGERNHTGGVADMEEVHRDDTVAFDPVEIITVEMGPTGLDEFNCSSSPAATPITTTKSMSLEASNSYVEVVAPNRTLTVIHTEQTSTCHGCMTTMAPGQNVTLEFLQSLSDTGKKEALQSTMVWCSTKELRSFCSGMGVRVRSKEYAAYHTKAGYTELLTQLLRAKSASKGLVVGPAPSPIVVTPVERTRKTKNCNLRLLNVLCSEFMAPFLSGMNSEPTQTDIDTGAVGGNNTFWIKFRGEFISSKPEYSRLAFQGANLTGFDLSTPIPHTSIKLSEMWSELWEAYNSALIRFTHSTEPNLEFADCCPSRSDIYYMRCWLNVKPNLLSEICAPLPASIALNNEALTSSVSANEGAVGVEAAVAVGITTPSRKRPRAAMNRVTRVVESRTISDAPTKDGERAFLMQSIRQAAEILTLARGSNLGSEVEETMRCELQQCTKRLKRIQQEEERVGQEAEEKEKN